MRQDAEFDPNIAMLSDDADIRRVIVDLRNCLRVTNLESRLEAERKASETPMLGACTSGAQLEYIARLVDDAQKTAPTPQVKRTRSEYLAGVSARPANAPVNCWLTTAATITPEQLREAFERAGINSADFLANGGVWVGASLLSIPYFIGDLSRIRPGPSATPEQLMAFYRQFDVVEHEGPTGWVRCRSEAFRFSDPASSYRLSADAKLVKPL